MFSNLRKFFRSRTKPQQRQPVRLDSSAVVMPLGLDPDQLAQIKELLTLPSYKHYLTALEKLYENNLGAMLRGLPHDGYLFQCGVCFALEAVARLPQDLIEKEKELNARHDQREHTDAAASAAERAAFVNTPFWDAYQRLGSRSHIYGGAGVPLP